MSNPISDFLEFRPLTKVVELRQTINGIFYIRINGVDQQNTFTLDINLANRFYEIATGEYKNNIAEDVIIKTNVATN